MLHALFKNLGLDDERVRLSWISASEGQKFAAVGNEFTKAIEGLGQNESKKNIFI